MSRKNHDLEDEIARDSKLADVLRERGLFGKGQRPRVRLQREGRAKRRDADFEKNWRSDKDSILITFEPAMESVIEAEGREVTRGEKRKEQGRSDPIIELLCALARAESRGFDFIALKWFRDTALPGEHFSWASDETERQRVLRDAIERRLILTHKVPNPKAPQFPVTAIRLNKLAPEVKAALGLSDATTPAHRPIVMRGEALSETVLRDRR